MQLSGELAKVSFPNLLQLVKSGGLTGRVSLSQGARTAMILVSGGLPVHAETEGITGREAVYELFMWKSGTFAFSEESLPVLQESIFFQQPDETFDRLIKTGLNYLEDQEFLDNLGVNFASVLVSKVASGNYQETEKLHPGLGRLDGVRTVADALAGLPLSRRELVHSVSSWLAEGFAEPVNKIVAMRENQVLLPDWVVARLKQDNSELSKAIVDMVIWVDRVKCWMYQADADLESIIREAHGKSVKNLGEAVAPPGQDVFS